MNLECFFETLEKFDIEFRKNEKMKNHTTFKIGGEADVFVIPQNRNELNIVLDCAKENDVPVFILGNGSNILVSDNGINGAVVSLSAFDKIKVDGERIVCGSGVNLSSLCIKAQNNSLTGLEFAYGIPGSVGGALFMNAGAYGGEMSRVVIGAYSLDKNGKEVYISKADMNLSYRNSIFKENGMIILEVVFALGKGNADSIKQNMNDLICRRKEKQPLDFPSAGSTFKRPIGNFAGTLIEKNGLKGLSVGGAMVSKKHAGFIINFDNASASDVLKLIETVKETVYSGDNVMLEPEIIFVGRK